MGTKRNQPGPNRPRARLWALVKDLADVPGPDVPVEQVTVKEEEGFFDGPVCPRVAILDFDPDTGALLPGVPVRLEEAARSVWAYGPSGKPARADLETPEFIAASVFGTVHRTIARFEQPDVLGRRVRWAFEGPQLLVVPRAGEWENAYYERESRSLQFFFFPDRSAPERRIHTALSADIVAHETTHAILDGIAPDLYGALAPQSLALHEAIADLGALSIALSTRALQEAFVKETGGELENWTKFAGIAREFAEGTSQGSVFLRDLSKRLTMEDARGGGPHELSLVLTGAMYGLWVHLYEVARARKRQEAPELTPAQVAGRVLWATREMYERMAFRALDYLPPGEATFPDYARALIAADLAGNPDFDEPRAFLRGEFVARGIVDRAQALDTPTQFEVPAVEALELDAVMESDFAAYGFVNEHRELFGVPEGVPFEVRPRLATEKTYYHEKDGVSVPELVSEVILKVAWTELEPQAVAGLPSQRRVAVGTTLAIDRDTMRVRVRITTGTDGDRRAERDRYLARLAGEHRIAIGSAARDANGLPRAGVIRGDVVGGALKLRNVASMLHLGVGD